jgi:predicted  nucleic acid-binding Zn-ribbon protein
MKVPNGVTYDKIADGCDGMAGKLTDTEREMPLWMLMNPEIGELKRRTDALEKRAAALEKRAAALEKEIVLLVWAIAAAAAAVAAVLLVCM